MKQWHIVVVGGGAKQTWVLDDAEREEAALRLRGPVGVWEGFGSDVWQAFREIRLATDRLGMRLCCNGARRNAHASSMSRQMSGGYLVYLLKFGQQARARDLVQIFDYAHPTRIASVADQDRFYAQWLSSLVHGPDE
ncbi:MAG: hypothetical protein LBC97_02340 [Bifidobacteriaceae bacterium]|jgi:hypothetical protein|nr:hypothetical protein [Bifidobacteriaceae bacterium]